VGGIGVGEGVGVAVGPLVAVAVGLVGVDVADLATTVAVGAEVGVLGRGVGSEQARMLITARTERTRCRVFLFITASTISL
jgi:hypothetical protein